MLLVIEVGNTHTKVAAYEGDQLRALWRLSTRRDTSADEYGVLIESLLRRQGLEPAQVQHVAISNVVPPIQQALEWMCSRYFGVTPYVIQPGLNSPIPLAVDVPREVGPDRVANAMAAMTYFGTPVIVIDFGTATNFDCVNTRGEFIGGAIAPGLRTSLDALLTRASRLYRVEFAKPKEAIGRNTLTNIQSGIVYGYAGLVDGIVERLRAELDETTQAPVIVTGGLATLIADVPKCIQRVEPNLTLDGVRLCFERARWV